MCSLFLVYSMLQHILPKLLLFKCVFRSGVTGDSACVTETEKATTPDGGIMHEYMHDLLGASGGLTGAQIE